MSKGSSKVRAADSQGGYIYTYVYMFQIQGKKKNLFFFVLFSFRVSRRISARRSFVCTATTACTVISVEERRDPAPEIQYPRSNSKRKIPG